MGVIYVVIVVAFVIVGVVFVRRTQRGAFVTRLPIDEDENVLLEEEGLKLAHRFRRRSVRGGSTVTHRCGSVPTDRGVLPATVARRAAHIRDPDDPRRHDAGTAVPETGYSVYLRTSAARTATRRTPPRRATSTSRMKGAICVCTSSCRSPRRAELGDPPEVRLSTANAARTSR